MESVALPAAMDYAATDRNFLVRVGDRRQVEMIPPPVAQQFSREVVLVEALHDQMIVPLSLSSRRDTSVVPYQSLTVRRAFSDCASSAFIGSSIMMTSAPRPVKEPPTGTAKRPPPLVVSHSVSVSLARTVLGKSSRYQLVVTTARN